MFFATRLRIETDQLERLAGAICYTTMMPCEMCTGAIIRFGITKVMVAETQSYVDSGTTPLMEMQGIEVEVGNDAQCISWVEAYYAQHPDKETAMHAADRRRLKV